MDEAITNVIRFAQLFWGIPGLLPKRNSRRYLCKRHIMDRLCSGKLAYEMNSGQALDTFADFQALPPLYWRYCRRPDLRFVRF